MGAVFALGFIWFIFFSAGVILDFIAVVLIVLRDLLKRKSKKKHIVLFVVGLLFLIPGSACLMPSVGSAALLMIGQDASVRNQEKRSDYFDENKKTDTVIQLEPGDIRNLLTHSKDSFEINGTEYLYYSDHSVEYRDSHRGKAIANLVGEDGELTVYRYNIEPTDCDIVCAGSNVYINSADTDRLLAYYSDGDFTYNWSEHLANKKRKKVEFPDDVFFGVINGDPEYTDLASKEDLNTRQSYYLEQVSSNGFFKRGITVVLSKNGHMYVIVAKNRFQSYDHLGEDYSGYFKVTDDGAAGELIKYMDG